MTRIPSYRPRANHAPQRDRQGVQRLLSIPELEALANLSGSESGGATAAAVSAQAGVLPTSETLSSAVSGAASKRGLAAAEWQADPPTTMAPVTPEPVELAVEVAGATVADVIPIGTVGRIKRLSLRQLATQATSSWRRKAMTVCLTIGALYTLLSLNRSGERVPTTGDIVEISIPTDPVDSAASGPLRVGAAAAASPTPPVAAGASEELIFAVPRLHPHAQAAQGNGSAETPLAGQQTASPRTAMEAGRSDLRRAPSEQAARPHMIPPVTTEFAAAAASSTDRLTRNAERSRFGDFDETTESSPRPQERVADRRATYGAPSTEYPTTPEANYHDPKYQLPHDTEGSRGRWQR